MFLILLTRLTDNHNDQLVLRYVAVVFLAKVLSVSVAHKSGRCRTDGQHEYSESLQLIFFFQGNTVLAKPFKISLYKEIPHSFMHINVTY